jgi:putative transposase
MDDLRKFIHTSRDSRELNRALAVHNTLAGRPRADVAAELGVSMSFVDKWRWRYKRHGVEGLRLGYKGSVGYLTATQRAEIRAWILAQSSWEVRALQTHLDQTYGVRYKAVKSYHALLADAQISWKKSQAEHPAADPDKVLARRDAIQKKRPKKPRPSF